ncbi:Hypothetical predicted protein [Pelobates cultripes]|uniref:Uncharacterized protein n=1 Tax=Pelobates cultripes TaxID=61616 RepID=A0AAD1RJP0_PELCU|nr:Hypothetical predicted protein [Pelobates cultripes]
MVDPTSADYSLDKHDILTRLNLHFETFWRKLEPTATQRPTSNGPVVEASPSTEDHPSRAPTQTCLPNPLMPHHTAFRQRLTPSTQITRAEGPQITASPGERKKQGAANRHQPHLWDHRITQSPYMPTTNGAHRATWTPQASTRIYTLG